MENQKSTISGQQYFEAIESGIELMDRLEEAEPEKAIHIGKMMLHSLDEQISKFTPAQINRVTT